MKPFLFFALCTLVLANSCKEKPTEPILTVADTTSHNFTWQIDTLGVAFSLLRDVCIINDTLAYAVGEIYLNDSLGSFDYRPYCLAKWNGQKWQLQRFKFFPPGSIGDSAYAKGCSIHANSATDIWMSAEGAVYQFDGIRWIQHYSIGAFANKIWGTSATNMYFVGENGLIAYYNGTSWQRMTSGTTVSLTDIYGTPDGRTAWACGWNSNDGHTVLLSLQNGQWQTLYDFFINNPPPSCGLFCGFIYGASLSGIWTSGQKEVMIAGAYVYRMLINNRDSVYEETSPKGVQVLNAYANHIRGSSRGNVAITGYRMTSQGERVRTIYHWNGVDWVWYDLFQSVESGLWQNIAVSKNQIIAVGDVGSGLTYRALVVRGRRSP